MMHRGFTLIELMVASCISAIILVSLSMALTGVWREAAKTNAEMQVMLKASAMRDKLLVGTATEGKRGFHGLLNITNEVVASGGRLEVHCANAEDARAESLPGQLFNFGKTKKDGKDGVEVSKSVVTNTYAQVGHRVKVYLWVETEKAVCRMPVAVTVFE